MHPFMRGGYAPGGFGMPGAMPHNVNVNLRQDKRGEKMSEERVEVKNIFQGGEGGGRGGFGGDGGLATAAAIAALGGRNQGGFVGGYGGDSFGFGGGGLGALLAVALLGRGGFDRGCERPVVFDHHNGHNGHDCCDQIGQQVILSKLGSIEGGVATAALQVQNSICEQTGELSGQIAALALGAQQGFANVKDAINATQLAELAAIAGVKDAVQNGFALTNTNLLTGLCGVKETVVADGDRTRALLVARFQQEDATKIAAQAAEIIELRNDRDNRSRHADLELKITNTNTAIAAQQQAQGQFQVQKLSDDVTRLHHLVSGVLQVAQASANQTSIIAGNLGAVVGGAQTATQTPINTKG